MITYLSDIEESSSSHRGPILSIVNVQETGQSEVTFSLEKSYALPTSWGFQC